MGLFQLPANEACVNMYCLPVSPPAPFFGGVGAHLLSIYSKQCDTRNLLCKKRERTSFFNCCSQRFFNWITCPKNGNSLVTCSPVTSGSKLVAGTITGGLRQFELLPREKSEAHILKATLIRKSHRPHICLMLLCQSFDSDVCSYEFH